MIGAKTIAALASGLLFGLGLAISQMVNPRKVLNFLDVTGSWDPSLALVLGGALAVSFVAFRFVLGRGTPVLAQKFELPTRTEIDLHLIGGAVIFGIGWGLIGLCPGPAIASLAYGNLESVWFVIALAVGLGGARLLR